MDWILDERTKCWSVQTNMNIRDYVDLVDAAHTSRGALSGQRSVLTTTTAKRIRERMVADLIMGAVLPPVVLGIAMEKKAFSRMPLLEARSISEVADDEALANLSIIDGMQRTAAMKEALAAEPKVGLRPTRVEFWITDGVRAMIYRMLVLNTGQVPWTMSRQLTVVYGPLLDEIITNVPELEKVSSPDKPGRRVGAAQYSTSDIVELYIAFSLRKTTVDAKEAVSDEFSRLDFVDNLSDQAFQSQFYSALSVMARIDKAFSRSDSPTATGRFARGRDIFGGQPARIGFIVALGIEVLGRPGAGRDQEVRAQRTDHVRSRTDAFIRKLNRMDDARLAQFLKLDVLREVLDKRVGQVGRYERSVFSDAFKVLVEEQFSVSDMEQCWRAS